ncbi:ABC transporter substrate-binding protein [Streptococcus pneumoniae]|nr:ABC transporter substrate-binding protein [Streptococcus pneumoniae]
MTAFQQLPSSVLQTGLFFSPSVSLDSQTVSAKEYLFPYQKERLKPFRQVTCFKSGSLGNSSNILPKLSHFVNFNSVLFQIHTQ